MHDGVLGSLGLMFITYDLDLVPILVQFVRELHLDIKVTADLRDVCTTLANYLWMVLGVNFQHQCKATQLLQW